MYREWWQHEGRQIWESRKYGENFCRQNVVRLYLEKQKIEHWKRCAAAIISDSVLHSWLWRCSVYIWSVLPLLMNCCFNYSCRSGWVMWFIIYDRMTPCWDWSPVMPYVSARKRQLLSSPYIFTIGTCVLAFACVFRCSSCRTMAVLDDAIVSGDARNSWRFRRSHASVWNESFSDATELPFIMVTWLLCWELCAAAAESNVFCCMYLPA